MKKIILASMAIVTGFLGSNTFAYGGRACACYELNRRVQGMSYVLQYGNTDGRERSQIQNAVNAGYSNLRQSEGLNQPQQEKICSRGNQGLAPQWVRWQPWLSQVGQDIGNPCD